jgi:hypothetical protein
VASLLDRVADDPVATLGFCRGFFEGSNRLTAIRRHRATLVEQLDAARIEAHKISPPTRRTLLGALVRPVRTPPRGEEPPAASAAPAEAADTPHRHILVVIDARGAGARLGPCVEAVLMQDDVRVRVALMAGDADVIDATRARALDPQRVEVSRILSGETLGAALNRVIADGGTARVAYLEGRERLLPGALARAATVLDGNRERLAVAGLAVLADGKGRLQRRAYHAETNVLDRIARARLNYTRDYLAHASYCARFRLYESGTFASVGKFAETLDRRAIRDMDFRILPKGRLKVIREVCALGYDHSDEAGVGFALWFLLRFVQFKLGTGGWRSPAAWRRDPVVRAQLAFAWRHTRLARTLARAVETWRMAADRLLFSGRARLCPIRPT